MEHRSIFGHVDLLAAKQALDRRFEPCLAGEFEQERHRALVDPVLRIVEQEVVQPE
jgi:hypothetical protein